jgi:hypothetical protein
MGGAILKLPQFFNPMLLPRLVQLIDFRLILMGKDRRESINVKTTSYAFK